MSNNFHSYWTRAINFSIFYHEAILKSTLKQNSKFIINDVDHHKYPTYLIIVSNSQMTDEKIKKSFDSFETYNNIKSFLDYRLNTMKLKTKLLRKP